MNKIPTMFVRDWEGTIGPRARFVLNEPHPDCDWVFAGEGVATRKIDGTSCLVRDGRLWKRLELKPGQAEPPGIFVAHDDETGKTILWVHVGDGPEDQWHREALAHRGEHPEGTGLPAGTYELVGPKIQKNPEREEQHRLVSHDSLALAEDVPRDYDTLRTWLADRDLEGVVFHHPDGRMAKIKKRDFGLDRVAVTPA